MGFYATSPAPAKGDPAPKNRVWGFFCDRSQSRPANRLQPPELRRKNGLTSTRTASGLSCWPSRDPIGEQGGVNLYGFVGNDGVNRWDFLGFCGSGSLFAEWLLVPHPGGESRFLPWSCFDEHGHHRKALCGRWLTANWPTLEKKCTELNCDPQVGFATTKFDLVGRTEAQFFSHIGMISHYDGIAYGSFKHNPNVDLEKTCKGNDCKCTFYIELQVTAKDRVDFNPGGRFGPWGIFRDDWFRFIDRAAGPWAGHNFNIAAEIEHRQIVYQWDYVKRRGKMLHND